VFVTGYRIQDFDREGVVGAKQSYALLGIGGAKPPQNGDLGVDAQKMSSFLL